MLGNQIPTIRLLGSSSILVFAYDIMYKIIQKELCSKRDLLHIAKIKDIIKKELEDGQGTKQTGELKNDW